MLSKVRGGYDSLGTVEQVESEEGHMTGERREDGKPPPFPVRQMFILGEWMWDGARG
jgi:hypothetical protein